MHTFIHTSIHSLHTHLSAFYKRPYTYVYVCMCVLNGWLPYIQLTNFSYIYIYICKHVFAFRIQLPTYLPSRQVFVYSVNNPVRDSEVTLLSLLLRLTNVSEWKSATIKINNCHGGRKYQQSQFFKNSNTATNQQQQINLICIMHTKGRTTRNCMKCFVEIKTASAIETGAICLVVVIVVVAGIPWCSICLVIHARPNWNIKSCKLMRKTWTVLRMYKLISREKNNLIFNFKI